MRHTHTHTSESESVFTSHNFNVVVVFVVGHNDEILSLQRNVSNAGVENMKSEFCHAHIFVYI